MGKSNSFTDYQILPKWVFSCMGISILGCTLSLLLWSLQLEDFQWLLSLGNFLIIGIIPVCAAESIYALFLAMSESSNIHKGSFDNPAGLASCMCFVIPYLFYLKDKHGGKGIYTSLLILLILTVFISKSRTGCVSALCSYVNLRSSSLRCLFLRQVRHHKGIALTTLLILTFLFCLFVYNVRSDSADGRILIWRIGFIMALDNPVFGHGSGSIAAEYMDYQANYLDQVNNAKWNYLADNTKHLFNEYLELWVQYGIIGLLLLVGCVFFIVNAYKKCKELISRYAFTSIISIMLFSCFSYPFSYPFTWIILFLSIVIIITDAYGSFISNLLVSYRKLLSVIILSLSLCIGYLSINRLIHEYNWGKIAKDNSINGVDRLRRYESLKTYFNNNPYFLYNYAMEAYCYDENELCKQIALRCRCLCADFNLDLLIGVNYIDLREYDLSQQYLVKAQKMCPNRFEPLYYRVQAYIEQNKIDEAKCLAKAILKKEIKIPSREIEDIKREMETLLSTRD